MRDLVVALSGLGLVGCTLLGCTGDPPPTVRSLPRAVSWLDGDVSSPRAEPLFEPESILERRALWEREPRQPQDLDAYSIEPAAQDVRVVPEVGVFLEWDERTRPVLRLPVAFEARPGTALEVEVRELSGKPLELRWRTATEGWAPATATDFSPRDLERGVQRYRFAPRTDSGWRGQIVELELRVTSPTSRLLLRRITAWRERLDPEQVALWSGPSNAKTIRVDLAGDVRRALLAVDDSRFSRRVPVRDAEFRAAVAVAPWSAPARFRVYRAGDKTPLWQGQFSSIDGWQEVRFALPKVDREVADAGVQDLNRDVTQQEIELVLVMDAIPGAALHTAGFWAQPAVHAPLAADSKTAERTPAAPLNVVLISIDTLRADHLSLYGYEHETSPNLDSWARERAVVFENAIAASPWTLPSHVSLFSGLDAHRHGVNLGSEKVPASLPLLAERLQRAGYTTQAITGGGYLHPNFGVDRGFDAFRYWRDRRRGAVDEELESNTAYALEWLDANAERPFFLFFHTYAVHGPLRAHSPHYRRFGGRHERQDVEIRSLPRELETGMVNRSVATWLTGPQEGELVGPEVLSPFYDSGIALTDQAIGQLLTRLDELGLRERTVVVITSDHGELLGEHGVYNHLYLYDENLRIPLLLSVPPGVAEVSADLVGRRVEAQARTVDIAPTLLDLLDLADSTAADGVDGVSLLPVLRGESDRLPPAWSYAASSNYGIALQDGESKVIHSTSVWTGADPLGHEDAAPLPANTLEANTLEANTGATLERQLRRGYLRDASGLRLRFQNSAPNATDFEGTLRVRPFLPQNGLKSTDLRQACPTYDCIRPALRGAQDFRVPGGQAYTLVVETPATTVDIHVGSARRKRKSTPLTIDVTDLDGLYSARWTTDGWQVLDRPLQADEIGVLLWWDGIAGGPNLDGADPDNQEPGEMSSELEAQLKALGYLQ